MSEIIMYRAEGGRVMSGDRPVSLAHAKAMRGFYLTDIADIEARHGDTDPALADIMIAHDLRCVRQLREAIKAAIDAGAERRAA